MAWIKDKLMNRKIEGESSFDGLEPLAEKLSIDSESQDFVLDGTLRVDELKTNPVDGKQVIIGGGSIDLGDDDSHVSISNNQDNIEVIFGDSVLDISNQGYDGYSRFKIESSDDFLRIGNNFYYIEFADDNIYFGAGTNEYGLTVLNDGFSFEESRQSAIYNYPSLESTTMEITSSTIDLSDINNLFKCIDFYATVTQATDYTITLPSSVKICSFYNEDTSNFVFYYDIPNNVLFVTLSSNVVLPSNVGYHLRLVIEKNVAYIYLHDGY